jgi:uncharacterized membrane protein
MHHAVIHHSIVAAMLLTFSRYVFWPYFAGFAIILIGLVEARNDISAARGVEKVVALGRLCYAAPLATFGAEHLTSANAISQMVPSFVPWHLFWAYFVGFALIFAALSIVLRIQMGLSGTLLGIMFVLFVAMMDIPGVVADPHNRFSWILALRELAFAGGAWAVAGSATTGTQHGEMRRSSGGILVALATFMIAIPAVVYGVEHFLHPDHVPGVPLEMLMPPWIPAHAFISYLTGAVLVVAGIAILLRQNARMAAAYLGTLILLLVLFIYVPIALAVPSTAGGADKVEALNYIFDTLFWGGTILVLAAATPASSHRD